MTDHEKFLEVLRHRNQREVVEMVEDHVEGPHGPRGACKPPALADRRKGGTGTVGWARLSERARPTAASLPIETRARPPPPDEADQAFVQHAAAGG